jgi:hypothetical protein
MTPYEVMLAYRFVDGFFPKPGHEAGKTGYSFALAGTCAKSLIMSSMRVNPDILSERLRLRKEWGPMQDSVLDMGKGKPFEECGREYGLPDFLPFVIPLGLVAAAKGTKDNIKDFENVGNPHELFDGKNSLLRRVVALCKAAEPSSGIHEKDKVSARLEYAIKKLQQGTSIREFVLSNGASSCAEVCSSSLFCFCSAPENFESVSKVASLGGKASLCACLVAALVGAYSGANFLPKEMKEGLKNEPAMENLAKELSDAAWQASAKTGGTT